MAQNDAKLPLGRKCELLKLKRPSLYYKPAEKAAPSERERIMAAIDRWHTDKPYYGVRRLRIKLREEGFEVGRKRIRTLMSEMGIYAMYPKPNLSKCGPNRAILPYLLRNKPIFLPNQVWSVDITYIKMSHGQMYLTAVIDWYSRFIVGWELSDTLDTAPVLEAVGRAIRTYGTPSIINSDQGSQFTSENYMSYLRNNHIKQSMDSKARWVDNVIIERWFRSLKYECIYGSEYASPKELRAGIRDFVEGYNNVDPHQSLGGRTPSEVYRSSFAA